MFETKPPRRESGRSAVVQRRGVERVQAILDSAETLLAEQGYAAATLKAIGEHAGIPTASLYHYFADRGQVDTELVKRHAAALDEQFAAGLNDAKAKTLTGVINAVVTHIADYFRANPSFVQLWFVGRNSTLTEIAETIHLSWAERLRQRLIERKLIRANTPLLAIQLVFEAGDRLFDVAFQRSPAGDDATLDEAKRMLAAHLQTYAPKTAQRVKAK
ncbi:TetR/AcrR family transcriptional regulator [Mycobacterium aquaticum]|uniref:TetR family transcriptional regulator n=1 Tax=Mycobacterium aquaticum TaxID=1927124 RepID=A0A1X0ANB0_9MYCO|nr:TetR/AcrR family transcriptional regulator [Mycobacterium aquaticum]ORA31511.1 TetR family transcriptional regulator [Mycobacterium aquaticum]